MWSDADTKIGHLSPLETCKAFAFHVALEAISEAISKNLQKPAYSLLGQSAPAWIAERLTLKGGGCPSERAVRAAVAKCKGSGWRLGQAETKTGGRPPSFTARQKKAMATAAMSLKRRIVRPTPAKVRAKLPRSSLNPDTGEAASDWMI